MSVLHIMVVYRISVSISPKQLIKFALRSRDRSALQTQTPSLD